MGQITDPATLNHLCVFLTGAGELGVDERRPTGGSGGRLRVRAAGLTVSDDASALPGWLWVYDTLGTPVRPVEFPPVPSKHPSLRRE